MSAQVLTLRPFQSARAAARSVGLSDEHAIRAIREAQKQGHLGNDIAGQMHARARDIRSNYEKGPRDPGSAA